jgi:hypothetical protein
VAAADVVGLAVGLAAGVGSGVTTGVEGAAAAGVDFAALKDGLVLTAGIGLAADEQAAATNTPTMIVAAKRECDGRILCPPDGAPVERSDAPAVTSGTPVGPEQPAARHVVASPGPEPRVLTG